MARESADKRVRVLVVEDNETTRGMYVRNMKLHADYRVETASDLSEALAALNSLTYHVAVVDIMLAGPADTANRDGTKVLDRIRELDEGTRAVVLSAQKEPQQVREFWKNHDAFDYLEKDELLKSGVGKMLEYVAGAAESSGVDAEPSWEVAAGALAGDLTEPAFVAEVMEKLRFSGGFENLKRMLRTTTRYLLPLLPAVNGAPGFAFDDESGAMVGRFWSKGQGCAVEFTLSGKGSLEGARSPGGQMVEREKGGLRVAVSTRTDWARDAFADSAR